MNYLNFPKSSQILCITMDQGPKIMVIQPVNEQVPAYMSFGEKKAILDARHEQNIAEKRHTIFSGSYQNKGVGYQGVVKRIEYYRTNEDGSFVAHIPLKKALVEKGRFFLNQ